MSLLSIELVSAKINTIIPYKNITADTNTFFFDFLLRKKKLFTQ